MLTGVQSSCGVAEGSHMPFSLSLLAEKVIPCLKNVILFGGLFKLGVPFWGPHNKDFDIFGSIFGSPYYGKLPFSSSEGPKAQC